MTRIASPWARIKAGTLERWTDGTSGSSNPGPTLTATTKTAGMARAASSGSTARAPPHLLNRHARRERRCDHGPHRRRHDVIGFEIGLLERSKGARVRERLSAAA